MDSGSNGRITKIKSEIRGKLGTNPHANVNNVNSNYINNVKPYKVDSIAHELAEKLEAPQNLDFYRKIAWKNKPEFLYQCLSITTSAFKENAIHTTKARYFYGVFRNLTREYNKKRNQ